MRTKHSRLIELQDDYDLQIVVSNGGAVVFYKNTMESDVIAFDEEVTENYFLDNFEMVVDLSKLQMNLHQLSY